MPRRKSSDTILSVNAILQVALALIDADGLDKFSMRRLAAALHADPMAVYHYFPDKDALLAAVVAHVFDAMAPFPDELTWQNRLRMVAQRYYALAQQHPHLYPTLVLLNGRLPVAFDLLEQTARAVIEAGFPPKRVVDVVSLFSGFAAGFVLSPLETILVTPQDNAQVQAQLAALPADRYPAIRGTVGQLTPEALESDFAFCLDLMIAGIEASATAASAHTTGTAGNR